jgi:rhodanese-related sulfurtransferase
MANAVRITPQELNDRLEGPRPVVPLDVRRDSYERSDTEIVGAMRIHPDELEEQIEEIPPRAEIITYCTCPNEDSSAQAAVFLNESGFRAAALAGGFEAWERGGFPTEPK